MIRKAGEVIPEVLGPVESSRTGDEREYVYPSLCPECGTPRPPTRGRRRLASPNTRYRPGQLQNRLNYLAGRGAFDIDALGERAAHDLIASGVLPDEGHLFSPRPMTTTTSAYTTKAGKLNKPGEIPLANLEAAKQVDLCGDHRPVDPARRPDRGEGLGEAVSIPATTPPLSRRWRRSTGRRHHRPVCQGLVRRDWHREIVDAWASPGCGWNRSSRSPTVLNRPSPD